MKIKKGDLVRQIRKNDIWFVTEINQLKGDKLYCHGKDSHGKAYSAFSVDLEILQAAPRQINYENVIDKLNMTKNQLLRLAVKEKRVLGKWLLKESRA